MYVPTTDGARAANAWLVSLGLASKKPWYVEIALDVVDRPATATYSSSADSRFHVNVYPEEWGVFFCHGGRASWIRVTDEPFVHGRDDHRLLAVLPELVEVGTLLADLEHHHRLAFRRDHALIRTNVVGGKSVFRKWISLL